MRLNLPEAAELRARFSADDFVMVEDALDAATCEVAMRMVSRLTDHVRRIQHLGADHRLQYQVITGDVIEREWQELFALYTSSELLEWIQQVTGAEHIYNSPDIISAININVMEQSGDVYRWHFDSEPHTLLLFLSSAPAGGGGDLTISQQKNGREPSPPFGYSSITPRAGTLVLMDGTKCYHHVDPLTRPWTRVSIPMVFPLSPKPRPAGLNDYLYREE